MMNTWFSSDLHFNHNKDFIYKARHFNSIQEHDETIIKNWNEVVQPNDECWILGDLIMGSDLEYGLNCLQQLNGNLNIIRGNHDTDKRWNAYAELPHITTHDWAYVLKQDGWRFYLCHYPTETAIMDDKKLKNHLINLYGHTHSSYIFNNNNGNPFQINVALDAWNSHPVSFNTLIDVMKKQYIEVLN